MTVRSPAGWHGRRLLPWRIVPPPKLSRPLFSARNPAIAFVVERLAVHPPSVKVDRSSALQLTGAVDTRAASHERSRRRPVRHQTPSVALAHERGRESTVIRPQQADTPRADAWCETEPRRTFVRRSARHGLPRVPRAPIRAPALLTRSRVPQSASTPIQPARFGIVHSEARRWCNARRSEAEEPCTNAQKRW